MLNININGTDYSIDWRHQRTVSSPMNACVNSICTCIIRNATTGHVKVATYLCPAEDFYVKETARKVSMTEALRIMKFTREERRIIWRVYFARVQSSPQITKIPAPKKFIPRLVDTLGITN